MRDDTGREILAIIQQTYTDFKSTFISSDICIKIILEKETNLEIKELFESLRKVEKSIQNKVAHDILPVTEELIFKQTGQKPK